VQLSEEIHKPKQRTAPAEATKTDSDKASYVALMSPLTDSKQQNSRKWLSHHQQTDAA